METSSMTCVLLSLEINLIIFYDMNHSIQYTSSIALSLSTTPHQGVCSVNRSTESFDSISIRFNTTDKRYDDEVT
jgi:hypothetical protein